VLVSAGPLVFTPKTKTPTGSTTAAKRKSSGSASSSSQGPAKRAKQASGSKAARGGKQKDKPRFFQLDTRRPRPLNATQQRRRLDSVLGNLAESLQAAAAPAVEEEHIELIAEAQLAQQEQIRSMQSSLGELTAAVRALSRQLSPSPVPLRRCVRVCRGVASGGRACCSACPCLPR